MPPSKYVLASEDEFKHYRTNVALLVQLREKVGELFKTVLGLRREHLRYLREDQYRDATSSGDKRKAVDRLNRESRELTLKYYETGVAKATDYANEERMPLDVLRRINSVINNTLSNPNDVLLLEPDQFKSYVVVGKLVDLINSEYLKTWAEFEENAAKVVDKMAAVEKRLHQARGVKR